MNIIILGDKFQKRMKTKGCEALIKINKKTILEHQYNNIKKYINYDKIVYITGFESEKLYSYLDEDKTYKDLVVINNTEYKKYNYAYTLYIAQDYLDNDCLIFFGENPLNKKICDKINKQKCSSILIDKQSKSNLGCIIDNNKIVNISYDLDNNVGNVYYIIKQDCEKLKNILNKKQNHNRFLFEIMNLMISCQTNMEPLMV